MDVQKLTHKSQEALNDSQAIANRFGHRQITPEHLLLALLEQQDGLVPQILTTLDAETDKIKDDLRTYLSRQPSGSGRCRTATSCSYRRS